MFLCFATYLAKIITDNHHHHQHCHKVAISSSHHLIPSWQRRVQELNYCFSASPKPRLLCSCHVIKHTCSQQHCFCGSFCEIINQSRHPFHHSSFYFWFKVPPLSFHLPAISCQFFFRIHICGTSFTSFYFVSRVERDTISPLFSLILVFETLCVSPWPGGH